MKIGIDGRFFSNPTRGGYKIYLESLIPAYAEIDKVDQFTIYIDRPALETRRYAGSNIRFSLVGARGRPLYDQVGLWRCLIRDRLDVAFFPTNTMPVGYAGHSVVTLHDTIPIFDSKIMPQITGRALKPRLITIYDSFLMRAAAAKATHVITVSKFAKADLMARLRLSPERITVVYPGKNRVFHRIEDRDEVARTVLEKWGLEPGFVLCLGSTDVRKNVPRVIQAYSRVVNRQSDAPPLVLVITSPTMKKQLSSVAEHCGIAKRVTYLSSLRHEELVYIYNAAQLLAFPSLYETFGNPCIEAMACGTPVVTSEVSAIPEIVQDAALKVDPLDVGQIADAILAVLQDKPLRETLIIQGLERAANFSWNEHARLTLTVFRKVVD